MSEYDHTRPFAVLLGDMEKKDPIWWCRFYKESTFVLLCRLQEICTADGDDTMKEIACAQFDDFVRGCHLEEYMRLTENKDE